MDYGLGNIFSIDQAFKYLGCQTIVTDDHDQIRAADYLILPGVGAFGEAMRILNEKNLNAALTGFIASGRPLLGICLGMQILLSESEELGIHQGLNFIEGSVKRISESRLDEDHYKVPHVAWGSIEGFSDNGSNLLTDISEDDYFYFVHSFAACPDNEEEVLGKTRYGHHSFCSVVNRDNIFGCQFHPEKSGEVGLKILDNYLKI